MKNYITRKVLNEDELSEIKKFLSHVEWRDGLKTVTGIKKDIKNNLESSDAKVNKIIMNSMDRDLLFHSFVIPKSSNSCILSKMMIGGYYHVHHDSYENGDYSTTVFLNEPNEYEGGELCLFIDNEEVTIKLNAGESVTYPTGIFHKVNEVTSGERIVAVFWTHTNLKDGFMREVYSDVNKILDLLVNCDLKKEVKTLEEASNDPYFIAKGLLYKINRHFKS
jgi:PKHD-type hydroxylase